MDNLAIVISGNPLRTGGNPAVVRHNDLPYVASRSWRKSPSPRCLGNDASARRSAHPPEITCPLRSSARGRTYTAAPPERSCEVGNRRDRLIPAAKQLSGARGVLRWPPSRAVSTFCCGA